MSGNGCGCSGGVEVPVRHGDTGLDLAEWTCTTVWSEYSLAANATDWSPPIPTHGADRVLLWFVIVNAGGAINVTGSINNLLNPENPSQISTFALSAVGNTIVGPITIDGQFYNVRLVNAGGVAILIQLISCTSHG